ncbi:MAG: prepilin-type N-terminal cleavage/methylation domain-containing protein [Phycisphaerales bacterium]|nr:prepilin-type N-terminal cleavage/methylation domain-containing protein [Phycisphaerales bacterium]
MRRPGFTIIELLIVVGLIAAMVAIVSPIVFDRLRTTREQETVEQVNAAINTARLDARREGRPLLLSAAQEEGGRIALRLKPAEDAMALGRIVLTLPERFLIERGDGDAAEFDRVAAADDAFVPTPTPFTQERAPEPELLGAFLPDGSAIAPDSFVIVAPSGVRTLIRIGAWAGPQDEGEDDDLSEQERDDEEPGGPGSGPDADEWGEWLGDPP